jgi:hypothetical protein
MIQRISAPVSVLFSFNHHTRQIKPERILWEGKYFLVQRVGFHHQYREGRTLFHVFSVVADGMFFRLVLNTDSLFWSLEEVSDGLPN